MNINFNYYLRIVNPFAVTIFFAYFVCTLMLFILPQKGVDFIQQSNSINEKKALAPDKTQFAIIKNLILKAIYKIEGKKSWVVIENKKFSKQFFLEEGQKVDGFELFRINSNEAVLIKEDVKFILKLDINTKNIEHIIKR